MTPLTETLFSEIPEGLAPEQRRIEVDIALQLTEELESLDFAEDLPTDATPEQMTKVAPALLRYMLSSGEKGYKDGIDGFDPEPSQDNNWLYDAEAEEYRGQFIDRRPTGDRVFAFTITRDGDEWTRSITAVSGVEA